MEEATETFRQLVIAARTTAAVGPAAVACVGRLNALFQAGRDCFRPSTSMVERRCGRILGLRLAAHRRAAHTQGSPSRRKIWIIAGDARHPWTCGSPKAAQLAQLRPPRF